MKKLFVIGNGFDLSHGLDTSYEDFHKYLVKTYPNAEDIDYAPTYIMDGKGNDVVSNVNEEVGFIEHILTNVEGSNWCNLEEAVGNIEFENYIMDFDEDEEDDDYEWDESYFNEGCALELINPILAIPKYFSRWISTIEIVKAKRKKDFFDLVNSGDILVLSFNYTKTIEKIYGIDDVCHIHGVQGGQLLFGHGYDYNYFSDDNYGLMAGTEESFQHMHDALKKNTAGAINSNQDFFNVLDDSVNEIYSYGFSFAKVDEIYIKEICNKIDTCKVTWFLNDYDSKEKRDEYEDKLCQCGFKGKFSTYSIKC
ncbi:Bacteriophage abortive infection AbiH [Anaerosporobacter mobilis DSM 15930]|uniref:Bacteriophage abortive infection AbiH n=1 Tax=Anaerosporobacter mobilis DSM 15930 TaxID=1120996 RepID=A0A1M7IH41_9FIRM|nr:bacteriophage abortive infection AbiH family protein [Anaerosporobacter mobilis]SHM40102.1 Bacteriophage abortive infection AbiH [Anaerosporobacter mobilis DSM 15930]